LKDRVAVCARPPHCMTLLSDVVMSRECRDRAVLIAVGMTLRRCPRRPGERSLEQTAPTLAPTHQCIRIASPLRGNHYHWPQTQCPGRRTDSLVSKTTLGTSAVLDDLICRITIHLSFGNHAVIESMQGDQQPLSTLRAQCCEVQRMKSILSMSHHLCLWIGPWK
jgi:hypothetical protein